MIEAFFRIHLRAPLRNSRWSWGAVREVDGAVFLRVWQDEKIKRDSSWYMRLTAHKFFAGKADNLGWQERQEHVRLVQGGAPCYMVMCEAVEPTASVREIRSFDDHDVFIGRKMVEHEDDFWLEMKSRMRAR
jgi:hypothetical protein